MVLLASGCTDHPAVSPAPLPTDPHTASALLKIATVFNHDHDTGNYAPVYARWDARSQAIITRADYIARHKDCTGGSPALSQGTAMNGPVGWVGLAVSLLLVAVAAGISWWQRLGLQRQILIAAAPALAQLLLVGV